MCGALWMTKLKRSGPGTIVRTGGEKMGEVILVIVILLVAFGIGVSIGGRK